MSKISKALLAKLERADPTMLERFADYGAEGFNPLIGRNEADTFSRMEMVFEFLDDQMNPNNEAMGDGAQYGLHQIIGVLWSAVQCERDRLSAKHGAGHE